MSEELNVQLDTTVDGEYTTDTGNGSFQFEAAKPNIYIIEMLASHKNSVRVLFKYNSFVVTENGTTYSDTESNYTTSINFISDSSQITDGEYTGVYKGNIEIPPKAFSGRINRIILGNTYTEYKENSNREIKYQVEGWAQGSTDIDKPEGSTLRMTIVLRLTVNLDVGNLIKFDNELTPVFSATALPAPCPSFISASALDLSNFSGELKHKIPVLFNFPTTLKYKFSTEEICGLLENTYTSTTQFGKYYLAPSDGNYGIIKSINYGNICAKSIFNGDIGSNNDSSSNSTTIMYPIGYYKGTEKNNEFVFCSLPKGLTSSGNQVFLGNSGNSIGTFNAISEETLVYPNNKNAFYTSGADSVDATKYYSNSMFEDDIICVPDDGSCRVCNDTLIFNNDNLPDYMRYGNINIGAVNYYVQDNEEQPISLTTEKYQVFTFPWCDDDDNLKQTITKLEIVLSAPKLTDTNYYVNQGEVNVVPNKTYDSNVLIFSKKAADGQIDLLHAGVSVGSIGIDNPATLYTPVNLNGNYCKINSMIGYLSYWMKVTGGSNS